MTSIDETSQPRTTAGPGYREQAESVPLLGLILTGLIVLAVLLRFLKLGAWNFEATEMFTLRDSVRPQFRNPRPLGYLLNYYLVLPFRPLDELGLRLVPAIAGVLAVPMVYAVGRRLVGTRAALFAALFVTLSGLQVFYSQFARYWSLVFLFAAAYPYLLFLGVRERSGRLLALGCLTLVLAVLAHPVAALAAAGPLAWLAFTYLRPRYLRQAWAYQGFRWGVAVLGVLGLLLMVRLVPLLQGWITMHDKNPGMGQFLLGPRLPPGPKQLVLLTGYVESLTVPVVLAAAAGIYLLWRDRDRTLGMFLASVAAGHPLIIALISLRTPVSQFYLLAAAPAFYYGAGVFLDRLFQLDWRTRPRWLLPTAVMLAFLAVGAPTLISQYRNGRRFDFRGVAQWLQPRIAEADAIWSDQPMVLAHYLGGAKVEKLRHNAEPLEQAVEGLRRAGAGGVLWVVAPAPAHAFRTNLKEGGLAGFLYSSCQLRNTVGRGRLDFRQQYLQVFRCPPTTAPLSAAVPPAAEDAGR